MRSLYTFFFYISLPFIFLRLLWQARNNKAYATHWLERLGFVPSLAPQNTIWIHAVSLGETIAATPLIKKLQTQYPENRFVITTTTPTGALRAQETFKKTASHFYFPYDIPFAIKHFIKQIQPQLLIIIETELWPNVLHICQQKNIPVFLANARLSEKSARGYRYLGSLTRNMLQSLSLLAVQTSKEAERFKSLGANSNRIHTTGSIKFDLEIPEDLFQHASLLKKQIGENRPVWIAASTHETEENILLQAHKEILKIIPNCLLIIVPRHPERFAEVKKLSHDMGFKIVSRSENRSCDSDTQIFLGDTMGELLLFYAASDIAFVGGSLIKVGGHNPLEPAALSLPILMGPYVFNFEKICDELKKSNALISIEANENSSTEISQKIISLLQNKILRDEMGNQGKEFLSRNRGALEKHLALIETLLNI